MSITKTADAPSVDAGGQAGYTVTISNAAGTSTATGLSLTDPLPTGVPWTIASQTVPGAFSIVNGQLVLNTASATVDDFTDPATSTGLINLAAPVGATNSRGPETIAPGVTRTITVTQTAIDAGAPSAGATQWQVGAGSLSVATAPLTTANVDAAYTYATDQDFSAGGATLALVFKSADLGDIPFSVTITDANGNTATQTGAVTSGPGTYTLNMNGFTGVDLSRVRGIDVTVNAATGSTAAQTSADFILSGISVVAAPSLAPGASESVHIVGPTTPSANPLTVPLTNTATVTVPNVPPVPPATATENVLSPDVTVAKTADAPSVVVGAAAGFTVTLSNIGPGDANGLTFSDPLPALGNGNAWTIDPASANASAFVISGGQLVLNSSVTTLAPGATLSVRITGTTSAADLTLVNTATVSATNEAPPLQNQQATATVNVTLLSLGDTVWVDANNDGKLDDGETGLDGVQVQLLDSGGNVLATTTTAGGGQYEFTNLAPGTYSVRITPPAGYVSSTGTNGSPTGPFEPGSTDYTDAGNNTDHGTADAAGGTITSQPVTLTPGATNPDNNGTANQNVDFGVFQPLSLGDTVWVDANNDGKLDDGETGLDGVQVQLLDSGGNVVATTTTAGGGKYLFTDLTPGTYSVRITPPVGYVSSTGTNGSPTGPFEPGSTDYTDAGNNTDHGTADATGGTITSQPVTLTAPGTNPDTGGAANLNVDFGVFQPLSLGDTVWVDTNNDGTLDDGETGRDGVPVQLLDSGGNVVAATTTAGGGKYLFTDLIPGTYSVRITPPAGYSSSTGTGSTISLTGPFEPGSTNYLDSGNNADHGTNDANGTTITSQPVTLGPPGSNPDSGGLANLNVDLGIYNTQGNGGNTSPPITPPSTAAVSGYVYRDNNLNGTKDSGEPGIGGTTVTLTGATTGGQAVSLTTTTDSTGFYQFTTLPAGNYTIVESPPLGFYEHVLDTPGTVGNTNPPEPLTNRTLTVSLAAGDNAPDYDFGEVQPAQLYGFVYLDSNQSTTRDTGELGFPNIQVQISGTAYAGTILARPLTAADVPGGLIATTDANGRYTFPALPPGSYTVSIVNPPAGFTLTGLQDGDPVLTSVDTSTGAFNGINLAPNALGGPFNFGYFAPNALTDPTKRQFLDSTNMSTGTSGSAATGSSTGDTSTMRANVPLDPSFSVSTADPSTPAFVVTAPGPGEAPTVRVFDYATGGEVFRFNAFESTFTGGVRVAVADVNGDGTPDIITVAGPGGGPRVEVFNGKTGAVMMDFMAFDSSFRGGLFVAAADVNGDGHADIIVSADTTGGPRVQVYSGADGSLLEDFFAFDPSQRGGVRVAAADFTGSGHADIVLATGPGVPAEVKVVDGMDPNTVLADYNPFEVGYTGGVNVATGDFNGDGTPDIIIGADTGSSRVEVFSGLTTTTLANFFAYEPGFTGGVRVAAQVVDKTEQGPAGPKADLIVAPGPGGASRVQILSATTLNPVDNFFAYEPDFTGGTYVG
ncbi:SdrD B-like domain-containing protein [Fimbriiglobus ruber]|uniref:Uncharacterized protein n=1 Tax=Fimbriiglobus ruber TaxID=1908690 RepID=A0A225DXL2_9BACT|nr:SdrD B-like domain-containing protein [Fimbriiglobus ruber]OWK41085.1 hypothetical protein FRUB_04977 [Fimbriiglobus ruber]